MDNISMNSHIKPWYSRVYPDHPVGQRLNDAVTFYDLASALNNEEPLYVVLGVNDSVVIDRVLDMLSETMFLSKDLVFCKWVAGKTRPDIVSDKTAEAISKDPAAANGYYIISIEEYPDLDRGATIVQYGKNCGLISFAFSDVNINEALARPELVLAELVRNGNDLNKPSWTELSKFLLGAITTSDFNALLIEHDDVFFKKKNIGGILNEINSFGLDNVITTNGDVCLLTVQPDAMTSLNWLDHHFFGQPCLQKKFEAPPFAESEPSKSSIDSVIQSASTRAVESSLTDKEPAKKGAPER